jgi:hypothetical protein
VTTASVGFIQTRTAAVRSTSITFEENSIRFTDRNMLMRSVSLPTRVIRSPVRLPEKKSSERFCMWA